MAVDIGTLAGRVEFEDKITSTMDIVLQKIDRLEQRFGGLNTSVKSTAEGFFLGELAIKAFDKVLDLSVDLVKDFTTEGAGIADVEDSFTHMAGGAGRAAEILSVLRQGTHDTITDFDLMKLSNDQLAAGVKLTDDQLRTMAEGGFALAQAKGIDVKTALDSVSDALRTGQVRAVQYLTGKIDLAAAEERYAKSLGTTSERLTPLEKQEAAREAILLKVGDATKRLGEQTDGVDEILAQISTSWNNFYENLIKSVAASPAVVEAFETIRDSLFGTFGEDSQGLVDYFVSRINYVAETVTQYTPAIIGWFGKVKDAAVEFYGGAVRAWDAFGPMIVSGFTMIKDWVIAVYQTVVSSWNALPEWLKTVAERTAMTSLGLYAVAGGAEMAATKISDLIGYAGNLTTTFSGLPSAFSNVVSGLRQVGIWMAVLDFSSVADAVASFKLMGGAILSTVGPLGIAAAYAAALYAAFELGKWEPVSDFFMELGLELQGFSQAEQDAMIAADKAARVQQAANTTTKEGVDVQAKMDEVLAKVEESLAAVTTGVQQQDDAVTVATEHTKQFNQAWDNLNQLGHDYKATLDTVNESIKASVIHYAEMGATVEDLFQAFPRLSKAQAEAAVTSVKASLEIRQVNLDTFGIISKAHGDNINRWIAGEKEKLAITLANLKLQGQLTQERLEAETAKFDAMVEAEISKRNEQSAFTKDFYEKQVDDAQNALDLMLADSTAHSTLEIQDAFRTLNEKTRMLNHWRVYADQAYNDHTRVVATETDKQVDAIGGVERAWDRVGGSVTHAEEMVRTITGDLVTAEEAQRRRAGGMYDAETGRAVTSVNTQITRGNLEAWATQSGMDPKMALWAAERGFSASEMWDAFSHGHIKRSIQGAFETDWTPSGPRIQGFKDGGYGDFGDGTLAMLHGKEVITPVDRLGALSNIVNNWYVNGTGAMVASEVMDIMMRQLKGMRQFPAA